MSPTARSLAYLREKGFLVAKVEQRLPIPGKFIARDCFQFGDLLCCGTDDGAGFPLIALVQVTSTSNLSHREKKIRALPEAKRWLECGGSIWLQGWSKKGARGERKVWTLTERRVARL